ncbi:hypothetical protein [Falsiphaeobacter marinintestinus]|uniref:hypothetical protein n=1 Tax=Falsiphaeobacter marinintestinus TaxID=1492905 RepID=UPI0011B43910|nr:hypothetical protein [Phaeobacter marinintestinus]
MSGAVTGDRLRRELPIKIRRTRARLRAEGVSEGLTVAEAGRQSEKAHRSVYRTWLRAFSEEHPRLASTARSILKLEGVI